MLDTRLAIGHESRSRETLGFAIDIMLVLSAQAGVFLYTVAHGSDGVAGIEGLIYTGLFTVVVVPAVELFFITWLGTTPGRALLGLAVRPARTSVADGASTAPIHLRLVARVIDAAMACVLFAGIFIVMVVVVDDLSAAWWKTTVLCFVLLPSIEAASIHSYGATPGKRKVGIRVVDAAHPERALGMFSCFARAYLVWFVFPLWWVLPIFVWGWAFADPQRRGLHDLAAGTKVTR